MLYVFEVDTNDDTGETGLVPQHLQGAEPMGAMTSAHDIMEHSIGEEISTDSELMALGACLYTRALGGYWRNAHTPNPAEHLASDIWELIRNQGVWGDISDISTRKSGGIYSEESEGILKEISEILLSGWDDEFDDDYSAYGSPQEVIKNVIGHMRKGFRRARRRYSGHSPYQVATVFMELENELAKNLRWSMPWSKINVSICFKTLSNSVELATPPLDSLW